MVVDRLLVVGHWSLVDSGVIKNRGPSIEGPRVGPARARIAVFENRSKKVEESHD